MSTIETSTAAPDAWSRKAKIATIVAEVCVKHRVSPEIMSATCIRRNPRDATARFEIYYRVRTELDLTFPQIGGIFSRHHTTIIYGYREHLRRSEAQ